MMLRDSENILLYIKVASISAPYGNRNIHNLVTINFHQLMKMVTKFCMSLATVNLTEQVEEKRTPALVPPQQSDND